MNYGSSGKNGGLPLSKDISSPVGTGGGLPNRYAVSGSPPLAGVSVGTTPSPKRTVLVTNHITNTNDIVGLVQLDYGSAMRGYQVCWGNHTASNLEAPLFQFCTLNDLVLLALTIALMLPLVLSETHQAGQLPYRLPFAAPKEDGAHDLPAVVTRCHLCAFVFCLVCVVVRFWRAMRRVYVEEVLAIRGVGLQLTNYGMFHSVKGQRFIDLKLLCSIVIHDAFFRYQPIFYLSSTIENEAKRVVYFEETLPRLEVLQPVLCGLSSTLFGEAEHGATLAEMEAKRQVSMSWTVAEGSKGDDSGADDTTGNTSEAAHMTDRDDD